MEPSFRRGCHQDGAHGKGRAERHQRHLELHDIPSGLTMFQIGLLAKLPPVNKTDVVVSESLGAFRPDLGLHVPGRHHDDLQSLHLCGPGAPSRIGNLGPRLQPSQSGFP